VTSSQGSSRHVYRSEVSKLDLYSLCDEEFERRKKWSGFDRRKLLSNISIIVDITVIFGYKCQSTLTYQLFTAPLEQRHLININRIPSMQLVGMFTFSLGSFSRLQISLFAIKRRKFKLCVL